MILFRKEEFPFGIHKINIYHKSYLQIMMIPPGGFFTLARKINQVEIEKDFSYGYTLTYGILKKFNKNDVTCKESLDFLEDKCKLKQVKCFSEALI